LDADGTANKNEVLGNFSVDLVNIFGCASSDQTELIEECDPIINAPTAFRPGSTVMSEGGNENVNASFRVFPNFVSSEGFQIFVFNRWGEMVFQSNDLDFRWNGGYKNNDGQPLPPGTYTYTVRYVSEYRPERGQQEKRGGVLLIR
jgi:gliding motility-associated-like protein